MEQVHEKTIDQKTTTWNNKMALSFIVSLLIGSNILNSYVSNIAYNSAESIRIETERIKEDARIEKEAKEDLDNLEAAGRRRTANAIEKLNYQITIKDLNKELKYCNDAR